MFRTSCSFHLSKAEGVAKGGSGSCGGAPLATTAPCGAAREAATARRRQRPPTTPPRRPTRSQPPPSPLRVPRQGTSWPSGRSGPPSASRPRSADSWYSHFRIISLLGPVFVLCNDLTRIRLCIGAGSSGAACAQGAGAAAGDRAGAAGAEAGGGDAAVHAGPGAGAGAHPGAPRADVHRGPGRAETARGAPDPDGHPSGRRGHHPLHFNGLRAPTSFI
jgi:hypothetical protein